MATTKQPKADRIAGAWAEYRAEAAKLNANPKLGWSDHLDADERLWRRYAAAERSILAESAYASAA